MLDNGAYEGVETSPQELAHWINELEPAVYVLPDKPGSAAGTVRRGVEFLHRYGGKLPVASEPMWVVHAMDGKLDDFIDMYITGVNTCKWIGFSRLTRAYGLDVSWRRRGWFARRLQEEGVWRQDVAHHALGMLDGKVEELMLLVRHGFMSCDSSSPVWRGLHGFDMLDRRWPNWDFNPLATMEGDVQLAESNLTAVLAACQTAEVAVNEG